MFATSSMECVIGKTVIWLKIKLPVTCVLLNNYAHGAMG